MSDQASIRVSLARRWLQRTQRKRFPPQQQMQPHAHLHRRFTSQHKRYYLNATAYACNIACMKNQHIAGKHQVLAHPKCDTNNCSQFSNAHTSIAGWPSIWRVHAHSTTKLSKTTQSRATDRWDWLLFIIADHSCQHLKKKRNKCQPHKQGVLSGHQDMEAYIAKLSV